MITLFEKVSSKGVPELGVVDGQHRLAAVQLLVRQGAWDAHNANIAVDLFRVGDDNDIADLFSDINRAEPVLLVDLPESGADDTTKEKLNRAIEQIRAKFPTMFRPSQQCRPPHLNVDVLRDEIWQSDLLDKVPVDNLSQYLLDANHAMHERTDAQWRKALSGKSRAFKKALTKARDNACYLALDKSWLNPT